MTNLFEPRVLVNTWPDYYLIDMVPFLANHNRLWWPDLVDFCSPENIPDYSELGQGAAVPAFIAPTSVIVDRLPWLVSVHTDLYDIVGRLVGEPVQPSPRMEERINVCCTQSGPFVSDLSSTPDTRFILHLFITDHINEEGQFFLGAERGRLNFPPRSGLAVLFDGSRLPHGIRPATMPMTYVQMQFAPAIVPGFRKEMAERK